LPAIVRDDNIFAELLNLKGRSLMGDELVQLDYRIRLGLESKGLPSRTCWLDGEECPYGRPDGQFLKRPERSCVPRTKNKTGCLKLNENSDALEDMLSEGFIEEAKEKVSEIINRATTSVSNELSALADEAEEGQVKEVLKLAAELVKEGGGVKNRKIVLLEDLDIE
jgi:hypothetical protein